MNSHNIKRIVTPALVTAIALATGFAFGQTQEEPPPDVGSSTTIEAPETNPNSKVDGDSIDEVLVTGSRIKRSEFSSLAPIEVVRMEVAELSGLLSATDILQSSNLTSGVQIDDSYGGYVTDGGPGANNASLRGLGARRTLVLVNGKRFVPSGTGGAVYGADLTSIPLAAMDRQEIYKDGASVIYGADAVAGVVNYITRDAVDGGTLRVTYDYPKIGEGQTLGIDGIWGKTADNWRFNLSGGYTDQQSFTQADTRYAKCPTRPRITDQDGDGVIDNRDPVTGEELCYGAIYGFAASPFGWVRYEPSLGPDADDTNPNWDQAVNGTFGIPYFTRIPSPSPNEGAFYRDTRQPKVRQVQYAVKNYGLNSQGAYDFSLAGNTATAYYEAYFSRREVRATVGNAQLFPSVPASNPSNPFGDSNPQLGFPATAVSMRYWQNPMISVDVDRFNLFAGLKGSFAETWSYDTYIGYGTSEGIVRSQQMLADRLTASLDAVLDGEGNLVCRDLEANPGCVAINLFTQASMIDGLLDPEAVNYLTKGTKNKTTYDKISLSGSATGELFDLPTGEPVSGAFGFEYRRESINDQPDIESVNGNLYGRATSGITKGSDTVAEVFGEIEAKLVEDAFLAQDITANLALRWTNYDSYGSDTTYGLRLGWQVVPWLLVKGTLSSSFRAPNLYEQHLESQTGFINGTANEPCWGFDRPETGNSPGDALYDNCLVAVGAGWAPEGLSGIEVVSGGQENLEAETSDSYTYSVVWQPESIDVSVSVTAWNFKIENNVFEPSGAQIINLCYNSVALSHPFCSRMSGRDENSELNRLDSSFINIGSQTTKGYDFDIRFEHEFDRFDFVIDSSLTRQDDYKETVLGVTDQYTRKWTLPKWRGNTYIAIEKGAWAAQWSINFIGKTTENPVYDPGTENEDRIVAIGGRAYHTLGVRHELGDWTLSLTANNIFDREPPMVGDGSGSQTGTRQHNTLIGAGYPLIGRTFIMSARHNF